MADTIRILVATDNHVGYNERDAVRGDDSWKTFHEIMCMAKDRDVDMVLLGGDLFHDNVPTRKSMYNVMRSLRLNCYGDKPCELEFITDGSKHFDSTIGHANYEDTNINVALPVFSIHGNHDDPSGDGHFAALDILEMSGLINYFGRVPRNDKIDVEPLCFQKGTTKLALYGLSNVRDERMHRTFRDKNVTFHQPSVAQKDWYNIAVVHQNHAAHSPTSHLPESFLPSFLDLVIWGHEHECDIEPHLNPEMGFRVMQPGSSVATSLAPGEAVSKHVAILTITGREMKSEPILLKTVRPFVYKEIVLSTEKEAVKLAKKDNSRHRLTQWLVSKVDELIAQAKQQWEEAQAELASDDEDDAEERKFPLPLVRLRVEHSSVDGIQFEMENPQRFSNRFTGRVANNHDVIQLHVKKRNAAARRLVASEELKEMMARPEASEGVKVAELVAKFLSAQSLAILPQNYFGDAVNQYIEKDDKHAMDMFVKESLRQQIKALVNLNEEENDSDDGQELADAFDRVKIQMEEMFANGQLKSRNKVNGKYRPKPANWNDELDGDWEDQPAALIAIDKGSDDESVDESEATPKPVAVRGRGRGRAGRATTATTRGRASAAAKKTAVTSARGKRKKVQESEEEDEDIMMIDDDDEEASDSQAMFFSEAKGKTSSVPARGSRAGSVASNNSKTANGSRKPAAAAAATTRKTPARAAATRNAKQSTLSFSTSQASVLGSARSHVSDIEDEDDDDDAFEPASTSRSGKGRK